MIAILDEALGRRARAALDGLSRGFLGLEPAAVTNPSIADGHAGIALAHDGLSRVFPEREHSARSAQHLDRAVRAIAEEETSISLHCGFTGVAWAALRLGAGGDANDDIDAALLAMLEDDAWDGPVDVVEGLAGIALYALERCPRPAAHAMLERIVHHLAASAVKVGDGIAWLTDPSVVPEAIRAGPDRPYYDLGVAHGSAGILVALAGACRRGAARNLAAELLERAVTFLLAHRLPAGAPSLFPPWVVPGAPLDASRAAWCYGDPGVAAALLVASRAVGCDAWERYAFAAGRSAAARSLETGGVVDACLCHGSAGLGLLYRRLYEWTEDPAFAAAARRCFAHALSEVGEGGDARGVRTMNRVVGKEALWDADPTFLTGGAGIALALLSATNASDGAWDRCLAISIQ